MRLKAKGKDPQPRKNRKPAAAPPGYGVVGDQYQVPAKLIPDWSRMTRDNVHRDGKVSFQKFMIGDYLGEGGAHKDSSFWYSVEDTLHSAEYIDKHERGPASFWATTLIGLQEQQQQQQQKQEEEGGGPEGKPLFCLDVGSNGGFYSLLSRSLGCSVLAVDGQPWCLTRLSSSAAMNGFTTNFQTRATAVSDQRGLTIDVGSNKCSGLWAVVESDWINKESASITTVKSTPLMELVEQWIQTEDVISMFKIDAEGSEMAIIKSALPLFRSGRIHNVLVEIAPARAEKILPWNGVGGNGRGIEYVLEELYAANYTFTTSMLIGKVGAMSLETMKDIMGPVLPPPVLVGNETAIPRVQRRRGAPDLYRIFQI